MRFFIQICCQTRVIAHISVVFTKKHIYCYSSDRKDKEKVNSIFLITILLKEIRKK